MVASSIGVAVRKAVADGLAEHFAADSDFNGNTAAEQSVLVAFGYDPSSLARERVYTGRCRTETPPAGMRSSRNTRNEAGQFKLHVSAKVVAGDAYDAMLRVHAIAGEVEDWFADRKSNELGVTGLLSLVVVDLEDDYYPLDNGTEARADITVRWTARLE